MESFCSSSSKRHIFIPARYKLPLVAHLMDLSKEYYRNADVKVAVIPTAQLKQLQFEYFQKSGSEYEAKHFRARAITCWMLVVTDKHCILRL